MSSGVTTSMVPGAGESRVGTLQPPFTLRPHRNLLTYNLLASLLLGPFFLFGFLPLYFRFRTLRYQVDDEGISMRWGLLFRREISLTYTRIQDIHLSSNFVERWLGLARIQVQTASGSASAEMTIEGILDYQRMRDFLYTRMRGARSGRAAARIPAASDVGSQEDEDLAAILRAAAAELRGIRQDIRSGGNGGRHA